jgi:Ser/Thr protein kinase RdoA (MazF antagonist)
MVDKVVKLVAQRYGVPESQLKPLSGGHFSRVYEFAEGGETYVLRITPPNDELGVQETRAVLAWMDFLSANGASVPKPKRSNHGRLVEAVEQDGQRYVAVVFERARGVLGEALPREQWGDTLYQHIGRTVGRMHALAKRYVPPDDVPRRPQWDGIVNCFNPGQALDGSQAVVAEKQARILEIVRGLPKDEGGYGLIHTDLHFANFFVDVEAGTVTIFDFDDCAYGWYAMDIAMTLLDAVVVHAGVDRAVSAEAFAAAFMESYLRGYTAETSLSGFWASQLPHFLKLLEIGLYAQVYRGYDPSDSESWAGKFMAGRKSKIEGDVPYVEVDFEGILKEIQR